MSHGLVKQDPGGAGSHYYRHAAALGTACGKAVVQSGDGFLRQRFDESVGDHLVPAAEAS